MKITSWKIDDDGQLILSTSSHEIRLELQNLEPGSLTETLTASNTTLGLIIPHLVDLNLTVARLEQQVESLTAEVSHLRNPNQ